MQALDPDPDTSPQRADSVADLEAFAERLKDFIRGFGGTAIEHIEIVTWGAQATPHRLEQETLPFLVSRETREHNHRLVVAHDNGEIRWAGLSLGPFAQDLAAILTAHPASGETAFLTLAQAHGIQRRAAEQFLTRGVQEGLVTRERGPRGTLYHWAHRPAPPRRIASTDLPRPDHPLGALTERKPHGA